MSLRFEMMIAQKRVMLKTMPNLALFVPPAKITGGVGEISELRFKASPRTERRV